MVLFNSQVVDCVKLFVLIVVDEVVNALINYCRWTTKERSTSTTSMLSIHDKYEIEYWSTKFGLSAEELLKAVEEVGNSSIDVKEHIRRKQ